MKKIYTIYVVCLTDDGMNYKYGTSIKGNKYKYGDRVWAWYQKFEDAEDVVLNNKTDIFECLYNYACIEKVEEGIFARSKVIQWYKAIFDKSKIETGPYPEVIKCEDEPEVFKNTTNLTIG